MQSTPTTATATGQQLTLPDLLDLAKQASVRHTTLHAGARWVLDQIAAGGRPVAELLATDVPNNAEWIRETGQHSFHFPLLSGTPLGQATADDLYVETVARATLAELQHRDAALHQVARGRHPGDPTKTLTGEDVEPDGKR